MLAMRRAVEALATAADHRPDRRQPLPADGDPRACRSSRATTRCTRFRPPRSWPRPRATPRWWRCTTLYPQYGFDQHKGYSHAAAPGAPARARRRARCTAARSRRCARCCRDLSTLRVDGRHEDHHLARQPVLQGAQAAGRPARRRAARPAAACSTACTCARPGSTCAARRCTAWCREGALANPEVAAIVARAARPRTRT